MPVDPVGEFVGLRGPAFEPLERLAFGGHLEESAVGPVRPPDAAGLAVKELYLLGGEM